MTAGLRTKVLGLPDLGSHQAHRSGSRRCWKVNMVPWCELSMQTLETKGRRSSPMLARGE